jgi:hypothetical protein
LVFENLMKYIKFLEQPVEKKEMWWNNFERSRGGK